MRLYSTCSRSRSLSTLRPNKPAITLTRRPNRRSRPISFLPSGLGDYIVEPSLVFKLAYVLNDVPEQRLKLHGSDTHRQRKIQVEGNLSERHWRWIGIFIRRIGLAEDCVDAGLEEDP